MGIGLILIFLIPNLFSMAHAFRGISEQKATGLGAVAGGLSEDYALIGMAFTIVAPIAAIVLLLRSLSPGHVFRSLISWLAIGWSTLMLFGFSLGAWVFLTQVWER